ncbi:MAG: TonB-dependent receptor [bacterium]
MRKPIRLLALLTLGTAIAARAEPLPTNITWVARDGTVNGRVLDAAGKPIPDATVTIVELAVATTTSATGDFRFPATPSGHYTVSARRLGYIGSSRTIVVGEGPLTLNITLTDGAFRIEPVNVTATRTPIAEADNPMPTSVLNSDRLRSDAGISLAHAVAQLPGVRNVSSGQQIGKPMIRGLFGPRVLVLDDGSRLEDYSWSDEDGPSIDARMAQRVEVIRGPASVLYGSEAMGGVVNVIPAELLFSDDGSRQRRASAEVYGASNNIELGSAATVEGAQGKYGWRVLGTGRFAQNYSTPNGELGNTSFWAANGEGALGIRNEHGTTTVRAAHYGGEFHLLESSGPEAADPNGGPVRQTADDRLQVTNDYLVNGIRFESKAQWQRHALTEVSDDCVPAPGQTTCTKVKDQVAFGLVLNTGTLDLLAHHTLGDHVNGTVGVSGMYQSSSSDGPITLVPGATVNSGAAFIFEQATFGPLSLVAGGRADTRSLSSDASTALTLAADSRSWSATSGDVGVVLRPIASLSITGNVGTGWRAPTLFDLYTNGPNLADARFEIGDKTLKEEHATDLDAGLKWSEGPLRAEASVFRNDVRDFIYTAPTGTTVNGLQVFRHVQGDARLTGGEFSAQAQLFDPLLVRASYDFVQGTDNRTNTPLPLMPPPRTILGARLNLEQMGLPKRAFIGAEVEIVQKQDRLSTFDSATGAYTLLNLEFSSERNIGARAFRFDADLRNATNTSYRDFLSRYKTFASAPGANLVMRVSTGAL